jgi:hypothetical protein
MIQTPETGVRHGTACRISGAFGVLNLVLWICLGFGASNLEFSEQNNLKD